MFDDYEFFGLLCDTMGLNKKMKSDVGRKGFVFVS